MHSSSQKWTDEALERLAAGPCGYQASAPPAAEPTALAALALVGADRATEARSHLEWLAKTQASDGQLTPFPNLSQPGWPTPLSILAWAAAVRASNRQPTNSFDLDNAIKWLMAAAGKTLENSGEFGHNGMLVGWPWVHGTHSWQEPTAWSVLALKAVGRGEHPRTREGVRMLVDRLLPTGGCNYGNTYVLKQLLRPHVEPTGVTMLALGGENIEDPRIFYSLEYLVGTLSVETTPISLSYGLLGLTPYGIAPASASEWLESAYQRTVKRDAAPLPIALLVLAAQGKDCPLIKYTQPHRA